MYCKKCGKKLKGNESVCTYCGAPVIHSQYMLGFWDMAGGQNLPDLKVNEPVEQKILNSAHTDINRQVIMPDTDSLRLKKTVIIPIAIGLLAFVLLVSVSGILMMNSIKKKDSRIQELQAKVQELMPQNTTVPEQTMPQQTDVPVASDQPVPDINNENAGVELPEEANSEFSDEPAEGPALNEQTSVTKEPVSDEQTPPVEKPVGKEG